MTDFYNTRQGKGRIMRGKEKQNMKTALHFLLISFLIWVIPFVSSFPFFGRDGKLTVSFWVFKLVMAVVLTLSSFFLFQWLYSVNPQAAGGLSSLLLLGLGAALISMLFDAFTVIPFNKMPIPQYAAQVASFYLLIVIISLVTGNRTQ